MKLKVVLLVTLLLVGSLSGVVFEAESLPADTEIQITTNTAGQDSPAVSGNIIVWKDDRNRIWDIYAYDLSTGTETQITTNTAYQHSPAVSGNIIVWGDSRNGNWDIYAYDLSTGRETQITTNTADQRYPAVSGNIIVWIDDRVSDNADIYAYDLSTGTETQITTNTADQSWPAVSGNIIVWDDLRNGNADIYAYDLSTGTETQITTNTADQGWPAVSGNIIVWEDYRSGNPDVYAYDLSTGTETQITKTTNTGPQHYPAYPDVSGNIIVWEDGRNGNADIYAYDLSTGTETQITTNTIYQGSPAVSGNIIVWEDGRNGNLDIYAMLLPFPIIIQAYAPRKGAAYGDFKMSDDVFCRGEGFTPDDVIDIYLVEDVAAWASGTDLKTLNVVSLVEDIQIDRVGNLKSTQLLAGPLTMGDYDVVADVDQDGVYTSGVDALDDNGVKVTSGLFVIPELPFGTLLALAACIVGLIFKEGYFTQCVTIFPSITPAAHSALLTGCYPSKTRIPARAH